MSLSEFIVIVTSFLRDIRGIINIINLKLYKISFIIPGTRFITIVIIQGDINNSSAIILKVKLV
jgi:hypothetical protein